MLHYTDDRFDEMPEAFSSTCHIHKKDNRVTQFSIPRGSFLSNKDQIFGTNVFIRVYTCFPFPTLGLFHQKSPAKLFKECQLSATQCMPFKIDVKGNRHVTLQQQNTINQHLFLVQMLETSQPAKQQLKLRSTCCEVIFLNKWKTKFSGKVWYMRQFSFVPVVLVMVD